MNNFELLTSYYEDDLQKNTLLQYLQQPRVRDSRG